MVDWKNLSADDSRDLLARGVMDVNRWEDDDLALRNAARCSNLPEDRLSALEEECFPDIAETSASVKLYLFIRNKIVQLWNLEPIVETSMEDVLEAMPIPFSADRRLISRVHSFLTRYGYINYGQFMAVTAKKVFTPARRKKIIVIGAGVSGIAAARQLVSFGFQVVLLEALQRPGGRVHSEVQLHPNNILKYNIEFGASIIDGSDDNPLTLLLKQASMSLVYVGKNFHVFDEAGKSISAELVNVVGRTIENILRCASYMHSKGLMRKPDGTSFSVQDAVDAILDLKELKVQQQRREYFDTLQALVSRCEDTSNELALYADCVKFREAVLMGYRASVEGQGSGETDEQQFRRMVLERDLGVCIERYEKTRQKLNAIAENIKEQEAKETSEVFMNQRDQRLLDFYLSAIECNAGASLSDLSLHHLNRARVPQSVGVPMVFDMFERSPSNGIAVLTPLQDFFRDFLVFPSEDPISEHFGAHVSSVEYDDEGVTVRYTQSDRKLIQKCDAVICTVPLGVLKKSVEHDENFISFKPPLPEAHVDVIKKMGFGIVNKVILTFDRVFWNQNVGSPTNFFGKRPITRESRGEGCLFYCFDPVRSAVPTLNVFYSGEAAKMNVSDDIIVRQVMGYLQSVFGTHIPKMPVTAVVTRWHEEHCTMGGWSYLSKDCDLSAYDTLVKPILSPSGEPRIFLAGEHTDKDSPGTLQGAWCSGVRAAAEAANHFHGRPFAKAVPDVAECVLLDSDDDDPVEKEVIKNERVKHENDVVDEGEQAKDNESQSQQDIEVMEIQ